MNQKEAGELIGFVERISNDNWREKVIRKIINLTEGDKNEKG